jgi:hypothetical protein
MNAIEHGAAYGQKGPVSVRFLGGERGFAFFVDNPQDAFVLRPYTIEELTVVYARKYGEIPEDATTIEAFKGFEMERKRRIIVDEGRNREYGQLSLQAAQMREVGVPYTRDNGILHMMFGKKATVGFEKTEETNRVIIGYFL